MVNLSQTLVSETWPLHERVHFIHIVGRGRAAALAVIRALVYWHDP